jgi:uncharacterized BrkB/YihY/UPF0761 family membrane protein
LPLFLALVLLVGVIAGFDRDGPARVGEELGMSAYVVISVATAADQSKRSLWILVQLALWAVYTADVGAAKVLRAGHAVAWDHPTDGPANNLATAAATFALALPTLTALGFMHWVRAQSPGLGLGALLAGIVPILAWLYLLGRFMVASAMLNATVRERRGDRTAEADRCARMRGPGWP